MMTRLLLTALTLMVASTALAQFPTPGAEHQNMAPLAGNAMRRIIAIPGAIIIVKTAATPRCYVPAEPVTRARTFAPLNARPV